ncbi:MAG: hypothetical protein Mars2KO_43140 [Maribacter sp.]
MLPMNYLLASNNGPTAPEAASFESVDATDMVNLVTGDMSYVMPLLNVPSPEGGYPIALSYHAGIAMDQEASWVGLGWNLNPGAINRSVNGFPDDWGKTNYNELIFDEGGTDDYYSFSIGGTLPNGITLGVSKSWGANRAWGGTIGYAGVTSNFGSNGINVGVGLSAGPLSLNLSQDGYGVSASLGNASVGYNSSSNKITGSYTASLKSSNTGVSINSQNGISSSLGGFSSASQTLSSSSNSDYYTNTISKGFGINTGFFWARYQHTRFEYSLFKNSRYEVNGALNPYEILDVDNDFKQHRNSLMDVKEYHISSRDIAFNADYTAKNLETFVFPNYDNYGINAQGISADMSPRYFEEVNLFNKGKYEVEIPNNPYYSTDEVFLNYLIDPSIDYSQYKIGDKLHFYLSNTNSSFLRTTSGDFSGPNISGNSSSSTDVDIADNTSALLQYNTNNDPTFESAITSDGNLKRNGSRKRDGTYVESFTNEQITSGSVGFDFIEAKGLDRNDYDEIPNGIGAFRITSLDGKTYHYSLPVLHYESVDKNFEELSLKDKKFFESRRLKPYATHWLLTAVTGSDYMDTNLDGQLDDGDYGYWVEFEYGKWSDGYSWRTPKTGYKAVTHPYYVDPDTGEDRIEGYKFFWGRKQVYYLDKIKTRTHTALFVKSLREDNQSANISEFNQFFSGQSNFDPATNSKVFLDKERVTFTNYDGPFVNYSGPFYDSEGNEVVLPSSSFTGKKGNTKYAFAPSNKTLKLDKIILLKNEYDISNKASGNIISNTAGSFSFNEGYFDVNSNSSVGSVPNLYFSPKTIYTFDGQLHQNVLDTGDITLSSNALSTNAEKVISFNYDYSLAKETPNSSAYSEGRLSLERVQISGKEGISLIPPYKFKYSKDWVKYDFENQDAWGYINEHPEAWSLDEITTPVGSKINIEYEPDSFYTEAAYQSGGFDKFNFVRDIPGSEGWTSDPNYANNITNVQKNGDEITVSFDTSQLAYNLSDVFLLNGELDVRFVNRRDSYIPAYGEVRPGYSGERNTYEIIQVNQNQSIKLKVNEATNLDFHEMMAEMNCNTSGNIPSGNEKCLVFFEFIVRNDLFTTDDSNGKKGGGLRVASVSVSDNQNIYKTKYDYFHPFANRISGITSYEPSDKPKYVPYIEELPAPNVMYEYVTVTNLDGIKVTDVEDNYQPIQKTLYQHEVLRPYNLNLQEELQYNLGSAFKVAKQQTVGSGGTKDKVYKYTLYDNLSILGRLKSVKVFNGLDHQLSATVNRYKGFTDDDQSQGVVQESFKSYARYEVRKENPNGSTSTNVYYNLNSSSKAEFPSVLESVTNIQGGVSQTTRFTKHDFLTGIVTETEIEKNGTKYKSEITPAYIEYGAMGSKSDSEGKANMLTQQAMQKEYVWKNGDWETIGANINTWHGYPYGFSAGNLSKSYSIYRKEKNYVWNGTTDDDGLFTDFTGKDDGFVWISPLPNQPVVQPTDSQWKLASKISKYDPFSMALEVEDSNQNKTSTKMGDNDTKIFAVGNAGYDEMFYSGAEDLENALLSGGVTRGSATSTPIAHTGKNALTVGSGQTAFEVTVKNNMTAAQTDGEVKKYKISLWAKIDGNNYLNTKVMVGNQEAQLNSDEIVKADQWAQLNFYSPIEGEKQVYVTSSSGNIIIDDFRVHPVHSTMTSYVYNKWDELTHIIGPNNMGVEYRYDDMGRLESTHTEVANYNDNPNSGGFKKTSENQYTYKY